MDKCIVSIYDLRYFRAIARPRLITVVVVCTADIMLIRTLVSSPNCCAIRGTSLAAIITPNPSKAWVCMVKTPRRSNVVCINVVKHNAMICFAHAVNPSLYSLGSENMCKLPTAICVRRMPPRLILLKKHLITQYAMHISVKYLGSTITSDSPPKKHRYVPYLSELPRPYRFDHTALKTIRQHLFRLSKTVLQNYPSCNLSLRDRQ